MLLVNVLTSCPMMFYQNQKEYRCHNAHRCEKKNNKKKDSDKYAAV